jgi:hypothetical protein
MEGAYSTYFDNFFLALRMARTDYKDQALHTLRAVTQASLGAAFTPLLAELKAATDDFDENLTERSESTADETSAYHLARTAWLAFVDDTMKDYVTPRLRKLPAYAAFKKVTKTKLGRLNQGELLTQSKVLLELYAEHQGALHPTLLTEAQDVFKHVSQLDESRDKDDAATDTTILDLEDDRQAIARAQRRVMAQLELTFDDPARVYSFFDFSKAIVSKSKKATPIPTPTPTPPL